MCGSTHLCGRKPGSGCRGYLLQIGRHTHTSPRPSVACVVGSTSGPRNILNVLPAALACPTFPAPWLAGPVKQTCPKPFFPLSAALAAPCTANSQGACTKPGGYCPTFGDAASSSVVTCNQNSAPPPAVASPAAPPASGSWVALSASGTCRSPACKASASAFLCVLGLPRHAQH